MNKVLQSFFFVLVMCLFSNKIFAATVLLYHHVSSNTPKSTSVSVEQFRQHLELIKTLNLQVVPLTTIVNAIKTKSEVNPNWIAITFDDGYRSVFDNALPILKEHNYPFTVFVNPNMVKPSKLYMDWPQLAELIKFGGDIANHTLAHENLVRDGLSTEQIVNNILEAEQIIESKLGQNHKILAFPYGEYNDVIKGKLKQLGFVGFAQHSGAINEYSDLTALTRFPANGIYANPKTLKAKINSLPFAIKSITPTDTAPDSDKPSLKVSLHHKDFYKSQLACFISGSSKAQKPSWTSDLEFEIASAHSLPRGRAKYNCTAPSIKHAGRFYWMSKLWIVQE